MADHACEEISKWIFLQTIELLNLLMKGGEKSMFTNGKTQIAASLISPGNGICSTECL